LNHRLVIPDERVVRIKNATGELTVDALVSVGGKIEEVKVNGEILGMRCRMETSGYSAFGGIRCNSALFAFGPLAGCYLIQLGAAVVEQVV